MGRRLVGAAVAGVLVLGGGVAVAAPASAAAVVRPPGTARTAPELAPLARDGVRAHRISQIAGSKSKSKTKKKVKRGFLHGFFHGFLGLLAVVLLVGLLATVLIVLWVRSRNRR
ncbi:hypothetical protein ACFZDG_08785 [Kitasatospora xanthocidica]|uniref:hypothetical protein n=1 Tax=Kitasatospora xanthocidica TaxID=83382 RepID=UPI0036DFD724